MTTEPEDTNQKAAEDRVTLSLRAATNDKAQAARLATMCESLTVCLAALGSRMHTARIWFHLNRWDSKPMPKIEQGQFLALSLLAGTAASLSSGITSLIDERNYYAASALLRQVVEIEYLAWAFANDPDEVVDWYSSTHEDRVKRWQPRHLRERSGGQFRGTDYTEHCETGGHPTPEGMRNLRRSEVGELGTMLRYELAHHGSSAWRYMLDAVALICAEHGVDPVEVLPAEEILVVIESEADWRKHDTLGPMWAEFNKARNTGFATE